MIKGEGGWFSNNHGVDYKTKVLISLSKANELLSTEMSSYEGVINELAAK